MSQIGLVTVPAGVVLALWLARRSEGRQALGLVEGAGMVSVVVGVIHLDYHPCPSGPIVLGPDQTSFSCGGFDGLPWLIAGFISTGVAAFLYWRGARPVPPGQSVRRA